MAAADGGATTPPPPADDGAPHRAPSPPPPPAETAPPDDAQLETYNNLSYNDRVLILTTSWQKVTDLLADVRQLLSLYTNTLHLILQKEWSSLEEAIRNELVQEVEKCHEALRQSKPASFEEQRVHYLVLVLKDPWHHPVLKEIMHGIQPEPQKVHAWVKEEGGKGAVERLNQLCIAGGKLEGAALRLALALAPLPPEPQVLKSYVLHTFAIEALLVLLLRARRTSECILQIKALKAREAVGLIGRLANRNKTHGRIWKNAHDTALLCGQVLVATSLVKPLEDTQLKSLALRLASLYVNCPDELAPTFRKLLNSADTATHIYIVCQAVQHYFQDTMRPFVCELYIRALTTGVNEWERQKLQDESGMPASNTSHKLANWFNSLADLLSPNPTVSAECILTAFSLHPSKHYFDRVQKCSSNVPSSRKSGKPKSGSSRQCSFDVIGDIQSDIDKINLYCNDEDPPSSLTESITVKSDTNSCKSDDDASAQSLISAAVLEGDGLELSVDLCRDLAVLLSGPRLKYLTWDLNWEELSQHCLSYMKDTEEGTKTVTTELKYVHLDYSQYEMKEPEVHDVYFGIEKGYEHHLEFDDDDDEDDLSDLFDSDFKTSTKQPRKKPAKKILTFDDENNKLLKTKQKLKDCKTLKNISVHQNSKERSDTETASECESYQVNDIITQRPLYNQGNSSNTIKYSTFNPQTQTKSSSLLKSQQNLYAHGNHVVVENKPAQSFYRKQIELYEARKKDMERVIFASSGANLSFNQEKLQKLNPVLKPNSHLSPSNSYTQQSVEANKNVESIIKKSHDQKSSLPQYTPQISNESNKFNTKSYNISSNLSNMNTSTKTYYGPLSNRSSLHSYRKQNISSTTLAASNHNSTTKNRNILLNNNSQNLECSQNASVDWEKLITVKTPTVVRQRQSIGIQTDSEIPQHAPDYSSKCYKNTCLNSESANSIIKSLNMTSTKLPACTNVTNSMLKQNVSPKTTAVDEYKILRYKKQHVSGELNESVKFEHLYKQTPTTSNSQSDHCSSNMSKNLKTTISNDININSTNFSRKPRKYNNSNKVSQQILLNNALAVNNSKSNSQSLLNQQMNKNYEQRSASNINLESLTRIQSSSTKSQEYDNNKHIPTEMHKNKIKSIVIDENKKVYPAFRNNDLIHSDSNSSKENNLLVKRSEQQNSGIILLNEMLNTELKKENDLPHISPKTQNIFKTVINVENSSKMNIEDTFIHSNEKFSAYESDLSLLIDCVDDVSAVNQPIEVHSNFKEMSKFRNIVNQDTLMNCDQNQVVMKNINETMMEISCDNSSIMKFQDNNVPVESEPSLFSSSYFPIDSALSNDLSQGPLVAKSEIVSTSAHSENEYSITNSEHLNRDNTTSAIKKLLMDEKLANFSNKIQSVIKNPNTQDLNLINSYIIEKNQSMSNESNNCEQLENNSVTKCSFGTPQKLNNTKIVQNHSNISNNFYNLPIDNQEETTFEKKYMSRDDKNLIFGNMEDTNCDVFLKDLYTAVNAGSDINCASTNFSTSSNNTSIKKLENPDNDGNFKEFLADLQMSVNAGSQPLNYFDIESKVQTCNTTSIPLELPNEMIFTPCSNESKFSPKKITTSKNTQPANLEKPIISNAKTLASSNTKIVPLDLIPHSKPSEIQLVQENNENTRKVIYSEKNSINATNQASIIVTKNNILVKDSPKKIATSSINYQTLRDLLFGNNSASNRGNLKCLNDNSTSIDSSEPILNTNVGTPNLQHSKLKTSDRKRQTKKQISDSKSPHSIKAVFSKISKRNDLIIKVAPPSGSTTIVTKDKSESLIPKKIKRNRKPKAASENKSNTDVQNLNVVHSTTKDFLEKLESSVSIKKVVVPKTKLNILSNTVIDPTSTSDNKPESNFSLNIHKNSQSITKTSRAIDKLIISTNPRKTFINSSKLSSPNKIQNAVNNVPTVINYEPKTEISKSTIPDILHDKMLVDIITKETIPEIEQLSIDTTHYSEEEPVDFENAIIPNIIKPLTKNENLCSNIDGIVCTKQPSAKIININLNYEVEEDLNTSSVTTINENATAPENTKFEDLCHEEYFNKSDFTENNINSDTNLKTSETLEISVDCPEMECTLSNNSEETLNVENVTNHHDFSDSTCDKVSISQNKKRVLGANDNKAVEDIQRDEKITAVKRTKTSKKINILTHCTKNVDLPNNQHDIILNSENEESVDKIKNDELSNLDLKDVKIESDNKCIDSKDNLHIVRKLKNDVIVISDSDDDQHSSSSDVEIVASYDPIAVDVKPSVFQNRSRIEMTNSVTPTFFTIMASDFDKKKPKTRRKKNDGGYNWGNRHRRKVVKKPETTSSLILVINNNSEIIKLKNISPADQDRLQIPCQVRIKRENLTAIQKSSNCSITNVNSTSEVDCLSKKENNLISRNRTFPTILRKSRGKCFKNASANKITKDFLCEILPTISQTRSKNKINIDSDKRKINTKSSVNVPNNELKVDTLKGSCEKVLRLNCKFNDNNQTKITTFDSIGDLNDNANSENAFNMTRPLEKSKFCAFEQQVLNVSNDQSGNYQPDVLNNCNMSLHRVDETKKRNTATKDEGEIKNTLQPDILHQSQIVQKFKCSNNSSSVCPDLINKTGNSKAFVTMQQPDIILSNDKNHIDYMNNALSQSSNVENSSKNTFVKNTKVETAVKTVDKEPFFENCLKTYQNNSYHKNKRKSESRSVDPMKRLRNDTKIDIPSISSKDINHTTHKVKLDKQPSNDNEIAGNIKELLSEEDSSAIFLDGDPIKENLDADVEIDPKLNFLSKNFHDSEECSRDLFFPPIFKEYDSEESIQNYIEKCENLEVIETNSNTKRQNDKYLKQEKGFGIRSGRRNLKCPLRGRSGVPATMLSDAVNTRPPLALHNFSVSKKSPEYNTPLEETIKKASPNKNDKTNSSGNDIEKELNNNTLLKISKMMKTPLKQFMNRTDENIFDFDKSNKDNKCNLKKDDEFLLSNIVKSNIIDKNIFSRVPGLEDLDFMRPPPSNAIVQVVQLGQSPVTSTPQNSLTALPTPSQNTTNEYVDITTNNSVEYRSPSHDDSHQSNSNENNIPDMKENDNTDQKQDVVENNSNKSEDDASLNMSCELSDGETSQIQITTNTDTPNSTSQIVNLNQIPLDKTLDFSEQITNQTNYSDNNIQIEEKESGADSIVDNQTNNIPSSSSSFISTNRGQTLVNLLSQKIIHSPVAGQHVQMTTFPKGTINALSLQQALAQILPSSLSQTSGDSVIQSTSHSTGPQVVHIVQGKSGSQNNNSFGSLLVDTSQSSVMNAPGTTQVLHIVQGKPITSNSLISQPQITGTTFSGLSLVDSNSQQSGNQVLHIVNAGVQNKNNTAQVLKRVNLLTSITNPQGNEQKMVQFVCKSADGKAIQLNSQHQRGMVLRLQPIDNSSFTTPKSENQTVNNISAIQSGIKPQNDQAQELKSRSVYEENYAKFIQNSSQIIPSSPEKSTSLPKFNQAFGKSVFQDNVTVSKNNDNIEQSQNSTVSVSNDQQNSQDLTTTLNLGQLSHLNSPPLLIRKNPQSNIVHQNVVQQVKQSIAPMNIQTIHGGVIYTRQIPVNTINLITVPSTEMIDEVQLQAIQKQSPEKSNVSEQQLEQQVVKIVSQDQQQSNNTICHMDTSSEETNQTFTEHTQNNVNTHPLLTQMRIKVPMLSKGNNQMVTGARVVRPVLQIQRNLIPGTNPAVYQQLVLTTAPTLRQPVPAPVTTIRPSRPNTATHQESNLSSSTLEQLREFDMVLEQVKERSTVQPGSNSSSTYSDTSPQRHVIDNNSDMESSQSTVNHSPAQREVLYSIGPNQTVNVTYVNQKVISKTPTVLTTTYASSDSNMSNISSQNSPSSQMSHGLVNTITHSKPCPNTPAKVSSKSIKTKPSKPANPSTSSSSKPSPVATKTSLQKPLEDEQTTQRILYILAEYKEQVENSPDKDKPAPRRRSNPPTNPTTSSKRKKGSSGSSKKSSSGQSLQEMSPLGGEDAGHTMGSEDSSCGLSQGECTDNSIQGPDTQSPQASPQKATKKLLFQPESDLSSTPQIQQPPQQQQRNVIIADGQTIAMTRPGSGKTTAVLMPANYLLPMSMVKGGQQITIVTNQGPKILSVPQGDGNTTNTLFLQRLISPAGLKPMLTRPGQVRHVRLPANTVQNLQAFNLSPTTNINSQDTSWIGNNSMNNAQPKLVVEYNPNMTANNDLNPDSVKSEISDSQSIKDENMSISSEHIGSVKLDNSGETTCESHLDDNIPMDQPQTSIQDSNISDHILQQVHVSKATGNTTLNLIQVHSLNSPDCGKLFSVQNSSGLNSLIHLSNKSSLNQTLSLSSESNTITTAVQESTQNIIMRKQGRLENQFLNSTKSNISHDSETDMKLSDINQLEDNLSMGDDLPTNVQQNFILSHPVQQSDSSLNKCHSNRDHHTPWSSNGGVNRETSSPFSYESSPHRLSNQEEHQDTDLPESEEVRELSDNVTTRVLRHSYSPSSSPTGPRHLYHKMFISAPVKKTFGSEVVDRSASSVDEDKQYVQVLDIRHSDGKSCSSETVDVTGTVQGVRNSISQSSVSTHSAASLRHKYAVMEHELRLQKSLSEECEDLGVDSPSASDLFPEAELLFAASPSSQFDQSQDGCILPSTNHTLPSTTHMNPTSISHQIPSSSSLSSSLPRESRILNDQSMDVAEESEFARMHPNTTFHSGEIELVSDDADDAAVNVSSKRGEIVRSVIEGIGSSGGITTFSQSKMSSQFSMVDLSRRSRNALSSLQSSDDYSEGADDSMNSAESKEGIINNKTLDGILTNEIVKRDLNLSSTESSVCMSSNIIQRNVTQVIRHASSDQLSLPENDSSEKLCNANISELTQNGQSFLLENSDDARATTDAGILKSIMLERDGRDALTCSSPEQHSELFWESNSNSNQSEEHIPQAPTNLLDFSSEDSNKCCKSPLSCEETNSTDSSSLGGHNPQSHNSHHPLRINSVIKTSVGNSSAADGPILHNALISNTPNVTSQDISKKIPINLNSIHKSDSNTSTSPEEDGNRTDTHRSWGRNIKSSGGRRVMSPRSLSAEINMGAEIETSSSEGVSILTKSTSGNLMHSGSSTPEEGSGNNRRVSLRGSGGIKRSCHCCGGTPTSSTSTNTSSTSRRARRRPPPLH